MGFPLPPQVFPTISMTVEQMQAMEVQAHQYIQDALQEVETFEENGLSFFQNPWEKALQADGLTIMRWKDRTLENRANYRVLGTVRGNSHKLMEFAYVEDTPQLFEWQQFLHQNVLDARMLATFATQTSQRPHHLMGIAWVAYQASSWVKTYGTFLHYLTYLRDNKGREIGAQVMIPMDFPEVSVVMDAMKVKRVEQMSVVLYRAERDVASDASRVYAVLRVDHVGKEPRGYPKLLIDTFRNIRVQAESRQLAQLHLMTKDAVKTRSRRPDCGTCGKSFGATRRRWQCRVCGDAICSNCAVLRETPMRTGAPHTFQLEKCKFCVVCLARARETKACRKEESDAMPSREREMNGKAFNASSTYRSTDTSSLTMSQLADSMSSMGSNSQYHGGRSQGPNSSYCSSQCSSQGASAYSQGMNYTQNSSQGPQRRVSTQSSNSNHSYTESVSSSGSAPRSQHHSHSHSNVYTPTQRSQGVYNGGGVAYRAQQPVPAPVQQSMQFPQAQYQRQPMQMPMQYAPPQQNEMEASLAQQSQILRDMMWTLNKTQTRNGDNHQRQPQRPRGNM